MLGGYLYYRYTAEKIRDEKGDDLRAIAELKISQLVQWQKERITDAKQISEAPLLIEWLEKWLLDNNQIGEQKIKERMAFFQKEEGFESIIIANQEGQILIAQGSSINQLDDSTKVKIIEAVKHHQIIFTDFYHCNTHNNIHFDIIAPIKNSNNTTIACIILRVDPTKNIYPIVQKWPTASKTAETILVKKVGDSVVYLNELRHQKNSNLKLTFSLSRKDLTEVQAALGTSGIFKGKDYRGADVLSYLSPVPETDWMLVSKVDINEILSELNIISTVITLFILTLMFLLSLGFAWIYELRQRNMYKHLWQTQAEFKTTIQSIGDAVITTDNNGKVKYLNPIAEQLTGWSVADAAGENLENVFKIINEETRNTVENPVEKVLREGVIVGLANHTMLISKNGTEKPIADSGSPIKDEEGKIVGVVLVFRDQTEERDILRRIRTSEEKFRKLFEEHAAVKLIIDPGTRNIIDANKAALAFYGYTKDELTALNLSQLNIYSLDEIKNATEKVLTNQQNFFEFKHRLKNGSIKEVAVFSSSIEIDGKIYLHSIVQDITKRKQAETKLQLLGRAIDQNPVTIVITNKEGYIEYVNPKFSELTGYTVEEAIGQNSRILQSGEHSQMFYKELWETILAGNNWHGEFLNKKKNGEQYWESAVISPVFDFSGKIFAFVAIKEDITEKKKMIEEIVRAKEFAEASEKKLMETEERYRKMFENMNSGISVYLPIENGNNFMFVDFNKSAERITNVSKDEIIGNTLLSKFPNIHKSPLLKALKNVFENGNNVHLPPFYYKDNQREGWRENFIYKLPSGEIVAIFEDVTDKKNAEIKLQNQNIELITAKDQAQESDRLKSAFLANMSHEIRTPMNGILGFSDLLKEPGLTGEQQQMYIRIIERSGARMLNVINNIIDISKIESGLMTLEVNKSNINEQTEFIYNFFKPEVEAKGIRFAYKNSLSDKKAVFYTDREKLYAILTNLVKNAIKYTNQGSIEFGYDIDASLDFVNFYVKDTGIGIPLDRRNAIFERFIQADIIDKMARQGAGLGLTITKSYVEMLGGKIWVESNLESDMEGQHGSTFYFTLPFQSEVKEETDVDANNSAGVEE
jgi:PAS domain S-box-containing protein